MKLLFENYQYAETYPRSCCGGRIAALLQAFGFLALARVGLQICCNVRWVYQVGVISFQISRNCHRKRLF